MDKLEGGGSFNLDADTGAVARHPESTQAEPHAGTPASSNDGAPAPKLVGKAAKVVPIVEIKE